MAVGDRPQPARALILARELKMKDVAEQIGVSRRYLLDVLYGRCPLGQKVPARLPEILGLPLEDLFDADLLTRSLDAKRDRNLDIAKRGRRGERPETIAGDVGLSATTVRQIIDEFRSRPEHELPRYVGPSPERDDDIRRRKEAGEAAHSIACSYGITRARVYEIVNGRKY